MRPSQGINSIITGNGILRWTVVVLFSMALSVHAQESAPQFTKNFDPGTIGPGSTTTLQFNIDNSDSFPVTELSFTDMLPAGVAIATPANAQTSCEGTLTAPDGGNAIAFSGGRVGATASCSIGVNLTSNIVDVHTNVSGDLISSAGNSGFATADLIVAANRPGFSKSFTPSSIQFGARSTLTFTIDNTANTMAASNLRFVDNLPPGIVIASPANASTDCSGGQITASSGTEFVSYDPIFFGDASVAAGASCSVRVDVNGIAVGSIVNVSEQLTFSNTGPTLSSGIAGAVLVVSNDDLSFTKSFTDDPVPPGAQVELEFSILNRDRRNDLIEIGFSDNLNAVLTGLEAIAPLPAEPCGAGSTLSGVNMLTLANANLPPEGSCSFSAMLQVPVDTVAGAYSNTTSNITGNSGGEPETGSPATDLLFIEAAPLLSKEFIGDPVAAGASVELEFTITNTSPTSGATNMAFTDEFDAILPTASIVPADGSCGPASTFSYTPLNAGSNASARLEVNGAQLDPSASCTFGITLDVAVSAAAGNYPNTTSDITATVDAQTVTGGPASDTLQVVAAPSLTKEFIDDPVAPGATVTLQFTLRHSEIATTDATNIMFSDDLSSVIPGLVATGLHANDVCGTGSQIFGTDNLTFTGGALTPGESCLFNVDLAVPGNAPPGAHTNTTSEVTATVGGLEASGNAGSDDLKIAAVTLTKEFTDDPVLPGESVTLEFVLSNVHPTLGATDIQFHDNLDAVLDGLAATDLPKDGICGPGSSLSAGAGNTFLVFQNGSLAVGESCTFDVALTVPAATLPDGYPNTTGNFSAAIDGQTVLFDNATDVLLVDSEGGEVNNPPICSVINLDRSSFSVWPPNHKLMQIGLIIDGDIDPDAGDFVTVSVESVFQDEPVDPEMGPSFAPDAFILPEAIVTNDYEISERVELRRERHNHTDPHPNGRSVNSDGRVYHLIYRATDNHDSFCLTDDLLVLVPKKNKQAGDPPQNFDQGALFDSTQSDSGG